MLEKRGSSITINRKSLKPNDDHATAQYPSVTEIEMGMHSIDPIGSKIYARNTSTSRNDQESDLNPNKHTRNPSPEVDGQIYGVQSHMMAPRQSQL